MVGATQAKSSAQGFLGTELVVSECITSIVCDLDMGTVCGRGNHLRDFSKVPCRIGPTYWTPTAPSPPRG